MTVYGPNGDRFPLPELLEVPTKLPLTKDVVVVEVPTNVSDVDIVLA
jgi:hypothetical protein